MTIKYSGLVIQNKEQFLELISSAKKIRVNSNKGNENRGNQGAILPKLLYIIGYQTYMNMKEDNEIHFSLSYI